MNSQKVAAFEADCSQGHKNYVILKEGENVSFHCRTCQELTFVLVCPWCQLEYPVAEKDIKAESKTREWRCPYCKKVVQFTAETGVTRAYVWEELPPLYRQMKRKPDPRLLHAMGWNGQNALILVIICAIGTFASFMFLIHSRSLLEQVLGVFLLSGCLILLLWSLVMRVQVMKMRFGDKAEVKGS